MATSGENSLTLDLMGNAFKDLRRNYLVTIVLGWSLSKLRLTGPIRDDWKRGT